MATQTRFPQANTTILGTWNNPTNFYADDGSYCDTPGARNVNWEIKLYDFGFSIPAGSTINSVTFEMQYKLSTTASAATLTFLSKYNDVARGTNWTSTAEPTTDTIVTKTANGSWTVEELNSSLMSANIIVRRSSNTACNYLFDYVSVTVDYTPAQLTLEGTATSSTDSTLSTAQRERKLTATDAGVTATATATAASLLKGLQATQADAIATPVAEITVIKPAVYKDLEGTAPVTSDSTASALQILRALAMGPSSSTSASVASTLEVLRNLLATTVDVLSGVSELQTALAKGLEATAPSTSDAGPAEASVEKGLTAGEVAAQATVSDLDMLRSRLIEGTASSISGAEADFEIRGRVDLRGSSTVASSTSDLQLQLIKPLSGDTGALSSASALLQRTRELAGSAEALSVAEVSTLQRARGFAGAVDGETTASAQILVARIRLLEGLAEIATSALAEISVGSEILLEGTANASTDAIAEIRISGIKLLEGTSFVIVTATAEISFVSGWSQAVEEWPLVLLLEEFDGVQTLIEEFDDTVLSRVEYDPVVLALEESIVTMQVEVVEMATIGATVKLTAEFPSTAGDLSLLTDVKCTITDSERRVLKVLDGDEIVKVDDANYWCYYTVQQSGSGDLSYSFSGNLGSDIVLLSRAAMNRVWQS